MANRVIRTWAKSFGFLIGIITFVVGCEDPPLQLSSNWMPRSVGGPIEIRPVPPANTIGEHYREWVATAVDPKVRLYEVTLNNSTDQRAFTVEIRKGETPMGRKTTTFVYFHYFHPTNGSYQFEWMVSGKQNPDLVRAGSQPKKLLLQLIQTRDVSLPRLQIVAIEGVRSPGVLIASTHQLDL